LGLYSYHTKKDAKEIGAMHNRPTSHVYDDALKNNVHTNMHLHENGDIQTTTNHESLDDRQKQNMNEIPDPKLDEHNQSQDAN
jgi:hypothetical protein